MGENGRRLESLGERVRVQACSLGLKLRSEEISLMEQHFALLQRWNPAVGLTAARDPAGAAPLYLEALQIVDWMQAPPAGRLLDLGSGGGFPGMVLAILKPAWSVTLMDRAARKVAFLQEAARTLGLRNLHVLELDLKRPEDLPPGLEPDLLTSKAVGQFTLTLDLLERRASDDGRAILLTGERGEMAIRREIERRNGRLRLQERRLISGKNRAFALMVQKV